MTAPNSPYGFAGRWTLGQLVAERCEHLIALTHHAYVEALPAREVARHTLALLALSERIAEEARASRWCYATDALAAGATQDQVATALGLPDEQALRDGLRDWAEGQMHQGLMAPSRRDEVLALITGSTGQQGQARR